MPLLKSKLVVTGIEIITITLQYAMFKTLEIIGLIEMPLKSSTVIVLLLALTLLLMDLQCMLTAKNRDQLRNHTLGN